VLSPQVNSNPGIGSSVETIVAGEVTLQHRNTVIALLSRSYPRSQLTGRISSWRNCSYLRNARPILLQHKDYFFSWRGNRIKILKA
jgi:hypothetical protein